MQRVQGSALFIIYKVCFNKYLIMTTDKHFFVIFANFVKWYKSTSYNFARKKSAFFCKKVAKKFA